MTVANRAPNLLGIWDLDRADALFDLRRTFPKEKRIGQRSDGRFRVAVAIPGEVRSYPVPDIAVLERVVRETLEDQRSKGVKVRILLKVMADTHQLVVALSAEANAIAEVVIKIDSTPPDLERTSGPAGLA